MDLTVVATLTNNLKDKLSQRVRIEQEINQVERKLNDEVKSLWASGKAFIFPDDDEMEGECRFIVIDGKPIRIRKMNNQYTLEIPDSVKKHPHF